MTVPNSTAVVKSPDPELPDIVVGSAKKMITEINRENFQIANDDDPEELIRKTINLWSGIQEYIGCTGKFHLLRNLPGFTLYNGGNIIAINRKILGKVTTVLSFSNEDGIDSATTPRKILKLDSGYVTDHVVKNSNNLTFYKHMCALFNVCRDLLN